MNDTFMKVWNSVPPQRPDSLTAFLGAIARNLSLGRYRARSAEKRGRGQPEAALDELALCATACGSLDDGLALTEALNIFLAELPPKTRKIFMRRYWFFDSAKEIAQRYAMTEGSVKMHLSRTRRALKKYLEKEGGPL